MTSSRSRTLGSNEKRSSAILLQLTPMNFTQSKNKGNDKRVGRNFPALLTTHRESALNDRKQARPQRHIHNVAKHLLI